MPLTWYQWIINSVEYASLIWPTTRNRFTCLVISSSSLNFPWMINILKYFDAQQGLNWIDHYLAIFLDPHIDFGGAQFKRIRHFKKALTFTIGKLTTNGSSENITPNLRSPSTVSSVFPLQQAIPEKSWYRRSNYPRPQWVGQPQYRWPYPSIFIRRLRPPSQVLLIYPRLLPLVALPPISINK
jgi:hypothetical protein